MPRGDNSSRSRPSTSPPKASKVPQNVPSKRNSSTAPPITKPIVPPPKPSTKPIVPPPKPIPKSPAPSGVGKPNNYPAASRPSRFREMAEMAGAVTVGSTIGHVAGQSIVGIFSRMFGGGSAQSPSTKNEKKECEFEMKKFLDCYNANKGDEDQLQNCDQLYDNLIECQEFHRRSN